MGHPGDFLGDPRGRDGPARQWAFRLLRAPRRCLWLGSGQYRPDQYGRADRARAWQHRAWAARRSDRRPPHRPSRRHGGRICRSRRVARQRTLATLRALLPRRGFRRRRPVGAAHGAGRHMVRPGRGLCHRRCRGRPGAGSGRRALYRHVPDRGPWLARCAGHTRRHHAGRTVASGAAAARSAPSVRRGRGPLRREPLRASQHGRHRMALGCGHILLHLHVGAAHPPRATDRRLRFHGAPGGQRSLRHASCRHRGTRGLRSAG